MNQYSQLVHKYQCNDVTSSILKDNNLCKVSNELSSKKFFARTKKKPLIHVADFTTFALNYIVVQFYDQSSHSISSQILGYVQRSVTPHIVVVISK